MCKSTFLRLKQMAWNGFKKAFVCWKTAFFRQFSGAKSGSTSMDTCASSYPFDSKSAKHCWLAKPVVQTTLPLGRLPSHISRKTNWATCGLGLHHQRANGFNHLRQRIVVIGQPPRLEVTNCDFKFLNFVG